MNLRRAVRKLRQAGFKVRFRGGEILLIPPDGGPITVTSHWTRRKDAPGSVRRLVNRYCCNAG